tara:strand:+ start:1452 stop:2195 length:744 start_codon:yes stop_codon:yes gene_type:complete
MISCKLQGGLGNYLFQVAAMYSLSDNVGFNIESASQVHGNIKKYLTNILRNINQNVKELQYKYDEPSFTYQPLPNNDNTLFNGYFQSETYLDRSKILDLYSIDNVSASYIKNKYSDVLQNSVSLHVRRGDYLVKQDKHPVLAMDYYNTATNLVNTCDNFLIFSDDIAWCRDNFIGDKFTFIQGEEDYIDLWLMSLCNHNIIANSSFSWWGAWLNQNVNKKVIAPSNWFGYNKKLNTKDLYCEGWLVI